MLASGNLLFVVIRACTTRIRSREQRTCRHFSIWSVVTISFAIFQRHPFFGIVITMEKSYQPLMLQGVVRVRSVGLWMSWLVGLSSFPVFIAFGIRVHRSGDDKLDLGAINVQLITRFVGEGCSNILLSSLGAIHAQKVFRFGGDERSNTFRLGGRWVSK